MNKLTKMDIASRYKITLWALVVLGIINITFILTVWMQKIGHLNDSNIPAEEAIIPIKGDAGFTGRYIRDELGLTPQQMELFRTINQPFRKQVWEITTGLSNARTGLMQQLTSAMPDTVKLRNLSIEIGNFHARLKEITCKYYLDIRSIATEEQQKKLTGIFSRVLMSELPVTTPGRGGQGTGPRWRESPDRRYESP